MNGSCRRNEVMKAVSFSRSRTHHWDSTRTLRFEVGARLDRCRWRNCEVGLSGPPGPPWTGGTVGPAPPPPRPDAPLPVALPWTDLPASWRDLPPPPALDGATPFPLLATPAPAAQPKVPSPHVTWLCSRFCSCLVIYLNWCRVLFDLSFFPRTCISNFKATGHVV